MRYKYLIFLLCIVLVFGVTLTFAQPNGATLSQVGTNSTAPEGTPGEHSAFAGNVSELSLSGDSTTQAWQGYYGNVTGSIQLADASSNVLYNWSLATPSGEVYASNSSSLTWGSIDCAGSTTAVEVSWGISADDVDGINETFNVQNHPGFFTGSVEHTPGECNNTLLYNQSGTGSFYEAILTDGTHTVFAAILNDSIHGFNGNKYDFEMIVLEDGHGGDTATTTYYFWVELE